MLKKISIALAPFFFPLVAFAQVTTFSAFAAKVLAFINTLLIILMAVAGLVFIYGLFEYFIAGDEEKKSQGKSVAIYGLIGLVLMLGFWTVVVVLQNAFGISGGSFQTPFQVTITP